MLSLSATAGPDKLCGCQAVAYDAARSSRVEEFIMNRHSSIMALAAGFSALLAGLLADAGDLGGWTKTLLIAAAAGLGVLITEMTMRSRR